MSKEEGSNINCNHYNDARHNLKRLSDLLVASYTENRNKKQDASYDGRAEQTITSSPSPSSSFLLGAVMRHLFMRHVCGPDKTFADEGDTTGQWLLLGLDRDSFPILRQLFSAANEKEEENSAVVSYINLVAKVIRSTEALSPASEGAAPVNTTQPNPADAERKLDSLATARIALLEQEEELLRCLYLNEVYPCLTIEERKNITHLIPSSADIHDLKEATVFLADVLLYFVLLHTTTEKRDGLPTLFLECLRNQLQQRLVPSKFLAYSTVWWVLCSRARRAHVQRPRNGTNTAAATPSSSIVLPTARLCFQLRADHVIKSFFRLRAKQSLTEDRDQLARLLEKQQEPAVPTAEVECVALTGHLLEKILSELVAYTNAHCLFTAEAAASANEEVLASATSKLRLPSTLEQDALAFGSALRACQPPVAPAAPKSKGFLLCRMISPSLESAHSANSVLRHCFITENAGAVASILLPIPQVSATVPPASVSLSTSANPFRFRRQSEFFVQSVQAAQTWCGVTDSIYFALLALTNAPNTSASQLARLFIAVEDTIALLSRGQCLATGVGAVSAGHQMPHAERFSGGGGEVSEPAQPSLPLDMLLNADDAEQVYSSYVLETLDLLCYFVEIHNPKHVGLVEEAKQCVLHHVESKLRSATL